MLLNSHILAYARCLAGKVCGLVRSTWGTSQGEDKLGARDKILHTKVARRACAGRAPGKHSPTVCIAMTHPTMLSQGMGAMHCAIPGHPNFLLRKWRKRPCLSECLFCSMIVLRL